MTLPGSDEIFAASEATWPPASTREIGGWTIREGRSGGKRVSSATLNGQGEGGIGVAEKAMRDLNQPALFMVRGGEEMLDRELQKRGYRVIDPVLLYVCPVEMLTREPNPAMTAFPIWPPLAITREIWAHGGIGDGRLAVMDRVETSKTSLLMRHGDRAAGAAFVATERHIAMIHAIEVVESQRHMGVGINILCSAAHWAQTNGARYLAVVVTDSNVAANGLYCKQGLTVVGRYHYRIEQ